MSNDVASIGLTYDGIDLQTPTLTIHLEIVSGLDDAAEVRGEDVVIPYSEGRLARPRRFDRRRIVLEGWLQGAGATRFLQQSSYRASRRILADAFDTARDPATLRAVLEDTDVTRIECRPLVLDIVDVIPSTVARVSVELEAVEDWEGLGS